MTTALLLLWLTPLVLIIFAALVHAESQQPPPVLRCHRCGDPVGPLQKGYCDLCLHEVDELKRLHGHDGQWMPL